MTSREDMRATLAPNDTSVAHVLCSYCGHTFAEHSTDYQGFWKCASKARCVCVMFMDKGFPVPVKKG